VNKDCTVTGESDGNSARNRRRMVTHVVRGVCEWFTRDNRERNHDGDERKR